jgi:hypothetical protein
VEREDFERFKLGPYIGRIKKKQHKRRHEGNSASTSRYPGVQNPLNNDCPGILVDIFVNKHRGDRVSDTRMWSGVLQRDQENKPRNCN